MVTGSFTWELEGKVPEKVVLGERGVVCHQGSLSSGWSFMRVIFYLRGLSSGWSLTRVVFRRGVPPFKVVFYQGGLSPMWSFTGQGGLSFAWSFTRVVSDQCGLSSWWSYIRVVFLWVVRQQGDLSPGASTVLFKLTIN